MSRLGRPDNSPGASILGPRRITDAVLIVRMVVCISNVEIVGELIRIGVVESSPFQSAPVCLSRFRGDTEKTR